MEWDFLFKGDQDENERMIVKVIGLFEEEFGDEMNSKIVLSILTQALMHACLSIGMNHGDFSDMLDVIDDEFVGW